MYSFDISYPVIKGPDQIELNITDKYPNCKWYASDCEYNLQKVIYRNNGYHIDNLKDIVKIDKELSAGIFISFITRSVGEECEHIFYHPEEFKNVIIPFKNNYIDRVTNNLSEEEREIYDYFVKKYGSLNNSPVIIEIEDGRAKKKSIQCSNKDLKRDLIDYLFIDDNSNRVGEFAIGTNVDLTKLIGNLLQEGKRCY